MPTKVPRCSSFRLWEASRSSGAPHVSRKHYLELDADYLQPRLNQAIDVELDPGDVVLFNNLLFHSGLPNRASTIRWSLDWRYQDATQPTMRKEQGHLARSGSDPERAVHSPEQWAQLHFS
jgi:ectoine hydroxylase-related dioxygenase (phytanoyl-CoA dioxygenase family)